MNVENTRRLINRLRAPATKGHFSMSTYMSPTDRFAPVGKDIHTCGTTACIAGYAYILSRPDDNTISMGGGDYNNIGGEFLGITPKQARDLFSPPSDVVRYEAVSKDDAADVLEHMLAHDGEISWANTK